MCIRDSATLAAIIDEAPVDHLTLLTTQTGKPFSAAGFGNWFRDRCNEAGLSHCSAHGLRKATARRLAEAGCTMHEIAAITGHASLSEIQRYTKAADQARLARQQWIRPNSEHPLSNFQSSLTIWPKN